MAAKTTVDITQKLCEEITKTPVDELISNKDWGKINFEAARSDIEIILTVANQIKTLPIELLPEGELNSIKDGLTSIKGYIDQIRAFSVEQGNPGGARDQVVQQLRAQTDQLWVNSQQRIPFLAYQKGDVQRNVDALNRAAKDARGILDEVRANVSAKKTEIDIIITAAREASATVGVAHFTVDFSTEAEGLEKSATMWLKTTMGLAAATVVAAGAAAFVPLDDKVITPKVVQLFTSKLVVLGAFFTATVWCGRLYKAAKHQAATNRHRANALKTFQAFTKAASDDATRSAVLLETTHSIFAITTTGYLDGEEVTKDSSTRVVEVVKAVASAAPKG